MSSASVAYQLPTFTGLVSHAWLRTPFVRDMDQPHDAVDLHLEARIRSGDYFVDLATQLDLLARTIDDHHTRVAVEDIVSDLIYLQDHYQISKNGR